MAAEKTGASQPDVDRLPERVERIGMVARWKPVHLGHAAVLDGLLERAAELLVGMGSSNRYDLRNPFTLDETRHMLGLVLDGREAALLEVPDLGHGPRWRDMVRELFGSLDLFVTANDYVRSLLGQVYRVVHPVHFVAPARRVAVSGTMVRRAMARGEAWQDLVPTAVARYLMESGLDERFRREFGLATLGLEAGGLSGTGAGVGERSHG